MAILLVVVVVGVVAFLIFRAGGDDQGQAPEPQPAVSPTQRQLTGMSTAELADQVLLLGFNGADPSAPVLHEVRSDELGGVIVGSGNWVDAQTGTALVEAIRAAGRADHRTPPLLVAAQEGGTYRTFADLPPQQTELQIGDQGSTRAAEDWARETASALRDAGFDLNLFPIADVATLDSPIADRAFSDDPAEAAQLTAAAIRGCREAKLACAAAHFPGLGAASEDTDSGPATVGLDPATLEARDLAPFTAAFEERTPAVELSLAFYAAYDPVTPAALSEPIATGLLRDQLGYEGVAITDDLGAGAVRSGYSVPKAAVAALNAGADLIRIDAPDDQKGVQAAIVEAVQSGDLSEDRLREAAGRVLELKRKFAD